MNKKIKLTLFALVSIIILFVQCTKEDSKSIADIDVVYSVGGLGDSYVDNIFKGVVGAKYEYEFSVNHFFPGNIQEAKIIIDSINDIPNYDKLLVLGDVDYSVILNDEKSEFANTDVLLVDGNTEADVWSIGFSFYGAAYLAGVAAAEMPSCDSVAFIAGMKLPTLVDCFNGFNDGFLSHGGKHVAIHYLAETTRGFSMIAEAEVLTTSLIPKVDLVVGAAGGSNIGIFNIIRKNTEMLAIGIDTDQSDYAPKSIIGSIGKRVDLAILHCISDYQGGIYCREHQTFDLKSEYTDFLVNPYFAESLNEAVLGARDEAISKEINYQKKH